MNAQPWEFIVVTGPEIKEKIYAEAEPLPPVGLEDQRLEMAGQSFPSFERASVLKTTETRRLFLFEDLRFTGHLRGQAFSMARPGGRSLDLQDLVFGGVDHEVHDACHLTDVSGPGVGLHEFKHVG